MILLLSLNFLNSAQAFDLPEFSAVHHLNTKSTAPVSMASVKNFRVQVFPHFGAYSTPQGREASASSVEITSDEDCVGYEAVLDANQEWTKGEATGDSNSDLKFNSTGADRNAYYACTKPFVINRTTPLQSIPYSGDFVVVIARGKVRVINIIDPDTYVKGVIPTEVEASWPMESLKAQAVATRTYAWYSVLESRATVSDIDMDDTVSYQAYMGNAKRAATSDLSADQTEGLVMLYSGVVIKSYFSADSGGYTEAAAEVFGALPYCIAKPESYDLTAYATTSWTKTFSSADLTSLLVGAGSLRSGVIVQNVVVNDTDRTASGRARNVTITSADGEVFTVSGPDFRYATKVRSDLFTVSSSGGSFTFNGKGYGHGVGMAQIGAWQYAKQLNWTYDQILKFYYDGVTITHD